MTEEMPGDNLVNAISAQTSYFPINSANPDVRRYYENSEENKILEEIILKEIETLEKDIEAQKQSTVTHKRRGPSRHN